MKYNLSKYNVKNKKVVEVTANSNVDILLNAVSSKIHNASEITNDINVDAFCNLTKTKYGKASDIFIDLDLNLDFVKEKSRSGQSDVNIEGKATSSTMGSEQFSLSSLNLNQGQTLEIDFENLTAVIDKANVIDKVDNISKWFDLLQGINDLEILTDGNFKVEIFWKDRWL